MRAQRLATSLFVISIFSVVMMPCVVAQTKGHPVTGGELIALVASESLDQNIAYVIASRGIAFRPTEQYRALLTTAGADAAVMDALKNSKISADATFPEQTDSLEILTHLAAAGKLIRAKQFEDAGKEIVAALDSRITPEAGFLMGHLQDRMQEWQNSATIYTKVIEMAPDFPGAHARLSFDIFKMEDTDEAMKEAQAAVLQYKDDPEAHKNMGLAMKQAGKLDGAASEFREALRLKPDYAGVHFNLALIFLARQQSEEEIAELRKAVTLAPDECDFHFYLGDALVDTGDIEGGIREERAAKRLDPTRLDVRNNLARALAVSDHEAARKEFEEIVAMAPAFQMAHMNLGIIFLHDGDYQKAEAEYRKAAELDPSDANAFAGIGDALEHQGKFRDAIPVYRIAEKLDSNCAAAYIGLGRIYLETKDYSSAARELRKGVNAAPAEWEVHSLLAEALADSSDLDGAIAEARESIRVKPDNPITLMKLARFQEKKGNLKDALNQCTLARQWNMPDEDITHCGEIQKRLGVEVTFVVRNFSTSSSFANIPQAKNPAAITEPTAQISSPTVTLKQGETVESAWQNALNAGTRNLEIHQLAEAEKFLVTAEALAEHLKPYDERAIRTFQVLGDAYFQDGRFADARTTFQRELDLTQKELGPQSAENQGPLFWLGFVAVAQKDFAAAETFYLRLVDISEKTYDPADTRICISLSQLAEFYQNQKEYEKAEPYMLRAYAIGKQADGDIGPVIEMYAAKLQMLYIAWGKFDKAEPYCRKVLSLREQNYGRNSRAVAESIQTLADVLDKVGKTDEAASLRKRSEAILGAGIPPKQQ